MLWEQGVVGSNPATPTIIKPLIIRYPLIVSGYFFALYLNIKALNYQQCNWLRGGCNTLVLMSLRVAVHKLFNEN